jgi:hypothetical protein
MLILDHQHYINLAKAHQAEVVVNALFALGKRWSASAGIVAVILSSVAAAVLMVAYGVVSSLVEGHLFAMWLTLWALVFTASAYYSGTAKHLIARIKSAVAN